MATGFHSITSMALRAAVTALLWLLALSASAQTVRYIHTDALGSVAVVTDQNRNVVERREYEPYGRQLTPAVKDGPGYTGHVQDAATGLTYMQQRYYDPMLGRFLSVDPVTAYENPMGAFNRYWYANNNPYTFVDPDGRQTCSAQYGCGWQPTPFNVFRDTFSGKLWSSTVGDTVALFRSDRYNPLSKEYRSEGQLQDAKFTLLTLGIPAARVEVMATQGVRGVAGFASEASLISHFEKHGSEFGARSANEYLNIGRSIMENGLRVNYSYRGSQRTGYIQFMGNRAKNGDSKFGFVGTNNDGNITTIHVESGKSFWKMISGSYADKQIRSAP